jgi:serine/threonine-protein kinase RCK2
MPPGVAVVDAFKSHFFSISSLYFRNLDPFFSDLIRHGKNHVHVRQDDHPAYPPSAAPPSDAQPDQRTHPERRQQQVHAQSQSQPKRQQQQQPVKALPVTTKQSQQLTREVEKIVREEREAQEKMPMYKGLENFKLVQKMGECAHRHPIGLC